MSTWFFDHVLRSTEFYVKNNFHIVNIELFDLPNKFNSLVEQVLSGKDDGE